MGLAVACSFLRPVTCLGNEHVCMYASNYCGCVDYRRRIDRERMEWGLLLPAPSSVPSFARINHKCACVAATGCCFIGIVGVRIVVGC